MPFYSSFLLLRMLKMLRRFAAAMKSRAAGRFCLSPLIASTRSINPAMRRQIPAIRAMIFLVFFVMLHSL